MTKISVDKNLCIGCGLCASTCSECFKLEDDGKSHPIGKQIENSEFVEVDIDCPCDLKEVALDCPVQAIIVEE